MPQCPRRIDLPTGLRLIDCPVYLSNGKAWVFDSSPSIRGLPFAIWVAQNRVDLTTLEDLLGTLLPHNSYRPSSKRRSGVVMPARR
jgi:hypothetical protein